MMNRTWRWMTAGMLGAMAAGCGPMMGMPDYKAQQEQANKTQMDMVGVLRKGEAPPGTDNTGWIFQMSGMGQASASGAGSDQIGGLPVDVSAFQAAAEANVGKRVVIKLTGLANSEGGRVHAPKALSIEPVGATATAP